VAPEAAGLGTAETVTEAVPDLLVLEVKGAAGGQEMRNEKVSSRHQ
jgi:hypothetical protein